MQFAQRFSRARDKMDEMGLDLLLIVGRENLIYFTGLTQVECMAVLIPAVGDPCLITIRLDAAYVREEPGLAVYGYSFPAERLADRIVWCMAEKYGMSRPRIGFERYFVDFATYDTLRRAFPQAVFADAGELFYRIRAVKEKEEVDCIRRASAAVCRGMEAAIKAVRPGVSELDILAEAEYAMLRAGSAGSPFRPQVVSGERALLTHPCAGEKKISTGEITVIHLGATYAGYCAKICRTVAVGKIPEEQKKVYHLLLEAQKQAIAALRPGAKSGDVDGAARGVVNGAGFAGNFIDYVGYGVGLRQSEFYPVIGKGRGEIIEAGMVIDLLLPTVYHPRAGGPRVTDVILVDEGKNEILTDFPRELFFV